ncbi:hypothetical protein FN846DRAFT_887212 [Sphaerosporella brunnea]|uniref:Uncharacterized protein n=1 Tax=Sphaerosporella brunnea TaxID=1250544 RepID=A0A5J5F6X7_9PEZI|nr:hypothetical protein FN846DRAFT_887212 [Sphaerosporella brunnea]
MALELKFFAGHLALLALLILVGDTSDRIDSINRVAFLVGFYGSGDNQFAIPIIQSEYPSQQSYTPQSPSLTFLRIASFSQSVSRVHPQVPIPQEEQIAAPEGFHSIPQ